MMRSIISPLLLLLFLRTGLSSPIYDQKPLTSPKTKHLTISPALYESLEELSRIVDISYCVGTPATGISHPFNCLSHCSEFPSFHLIKSWNTGPLMSDSCGYIALSHPPAEKRIIIAFRGTYSVTNAIVDLSTAGQEYVPYPPSNSSEPGNGNGDDDGDDDGDGEGTPVDPGNKCMGCWAHAGFLESWKVAAKIVVPIIQELLPVWGPQGYKLELVGHSLGGAVAALAALEFRERGWPCRVTTFGEPKVGNPELAAYLDELFTPDTYRRVTHKSDPVPLLPFSKWGFQQHEAEFYIDKVDLPQTADDVRICDGDEDQECAAGGSVNMLQLLWSHRDYFNRLGLCVPSGWRGIGGIMPGARDDGNTTSEENNSIFN